MEFFKFNDHSKNTKDVLTKEEIKAFSLCICSFAAEVIKEDEESVTVSLITWESNGDVRHESTWVILKKEIIERWPIIRPKKRP